MLREDPALAAPGPLREGGGPDPAVAALRTAVRGGCADLPRGALVLVACSGGPDSLALAATAAWVGPRAGWRAGAVVVDHGLQPGSADVAARAGATCAGLGLDPVEVVAVPAAGARAGGGAGGGTGGGSPEAAARRARYAALEQAAVRHGAAAVLLGHTRDDQAEQVLLGLARGSGARSLAGMPTRRGLHRRPLLALPREATARACAALGLRPWEDPSNTDLAMTRNRVRARVLPVLEAELGPGAAAALARTADQLREDADVLEALAADLLARARLPGGDGEDGGHGGDGEHGGDGADRAGVREVVLDVAVLGGAPAALRRRALRAALLAAGCPAGDLARTHVLAVDALVTAWRGQGPLHLPGRVGARRACGRLALTRPGAGGRGPEKDQP